MYVLYVLYVCMYVVPVTACAETVVGSLAMSADAASRRAPYDPVRPKDIQTHIHTHMSRRNSETI